MSKRYTIAVAVLLIAGMASLSHAGARFVAPGDSDGDVVFGAAKAFLDAVESGDQAKALALFDGVGQQREIVLARVALAEAAKKVDAGASKLFDAPGHPRAYLVEALADIDLRQLRQPMLLNESDACIGAGMAPVAGLDLHRTGTTWKVSRLAVLSREAAPTLLFYQSLLKAVDELQQKLTNKDLQSGGELKQAIEAKLKDLSEAWEPGKPQEAARPAALARDPGDLSALHDAAFRDPRVQALVDSLPATPRLVFLKDVFVISSYEGGLSMSFGFPGGKLRSIQLFGSGSDEYAAYGGKLPSELIFGEARSAVEAKIGQPNDITFGVDGLLVTYGASGFEAFYASTIRKDPAAPLSRLTLIAPTTDAPSGHIPALAIRRIVGPSHAAPAEDVTINSTIGSVRVAKKVLLDASAFDEVTRLPQRNATDATKISLSLNATGLLQLREIGKREFIDQVAIMLDGRPVAATLMEETLTFRLDPATKPEAVSNILRELRLAVYSLPARK